MNCSSELLTPNLCEDISRLIHTMLIAAQKQRADLLTEPCRNWLRAASTESQIAKITAAISQQVDIPALFNAIENILSKLFIPAFNGSKAKSQLLERIKALIVERKTQPETQCEDIHQIEDNQNHEVDGHSAKPDQVGLLLVDAENISLPKALENFLENIGQYPMRYRLAFGNWRKLGERDQEFYRRGYQMIHVPSGKNSTDIKMSLDASIISLRNPSIREVFICSTDSDLLHLGHTLLNLGIIPYRVSRCHNSFEIVNLTNQVAHLFQLPQEDKTNQQNTPVTIEQKSEITIDSETQDSTTPKAHKVPTPGEMKRWLKILILQEQQANPGQPIKISHLGKLFRDRNQVSVNQVLQSYPDYKNLTQFLKAHEIFELSPPDGQHVTVTLKNPTLEPTSTPKSDKQNTKTDKVQHITSTQILEQTLIKLLWNLSSQQSGNQVHLSILGTHFAQVHKEPLSKVLERLGESKKLPKFLAKCRSLRIQKRGNNWWVALACVS